MKQLDLVGLSARPACASCGRTDGVLLKCAWHPDESPTCVDHGRDCVCPACVRGDPPDMIGPNGRRAP